MPTLGNSALAAPREDDSPQDALDLHFRKMSSYPLLTHAGEIALARRLEKADLAIVRHLLGAREGREALREIARGLRAGELDPQDIERNPEESSLAERIARAVAGAERRRAGRPSCRPSARLRLHPKGLRVADALLREIGAPRAMTDELDRLRREADAATAELVHANLRIVVTFARRYRGMPLVDLIQEGNFGLLRAIDKFDHRRGLRFSTYAAWWIRHALTRALADQGKMIRLPVHLTGAVHRVRRAEERLRRETGRAPTPEELAARTSMPVAQVRRALDVVAQPVSLDAATGEREAGDIGEIVSDPAAPSVDDEVAERELAADARALLATLPAREAEILRLRFGIDDAGEKPPRTLEEIGARFKLSRERARQLERDALRKLRVVSDERRLRSHLSR